MTPHPEKRLIAIDAETVERVRKMLTSYYLSSNDYDALLPLAWKAWEEGITPDEAELLSWAAEESAPYLNTEGERRRLRLADRKLIPLLPDPAPQEAE